MSLQPRKLEYTDFSAGITENVVPGKQNAYARADNLLITNDKQLESRFGGHLYGGETYGFWSLSEGQRVNALINFDHNRALYGVSVDLFYAPKDDNTGWRTVNGPFGGAAFYQNTDQDHVAWGAWRGHLFLVPDGGGYPQKLYRDSSDVLQLRQAGLPKPVLTAPVATPAEQLAAAIALAIEVRAKMLAHFSDLNAHIAEDTSGAGALNALVDPISSADLQAYVIVLCDAYDDHIDDAQLSYSTGPQIFHINSNEGPSTGFLGNIQLLNLDRDSSLAAVTDLSTAIAALNDLRNKYNWHTYALITHLNAVSALTTSYSVTPRSTDWSGLGANVVTLPVVATALGPLVSDTAGAFLTYLNQMKEEFNTHLGLAGFLAHNNEDADNTIQAPDATDLFSAVTLLNHLEFSYWWHYKDAVWADLSLNPMVIEHFRATSTASSDTMASSTVDGSTLTGYRLMNVYSNDPFDEWQVQPLYASSFITTAAVTGGTGTTVVFDQPITSSLTTKHFRVTTSLYHYDKDQNPAAATSPVDYSRRMAALDYSLTDLDLLIVASQFFIGKLKSHELSGMEESTVNSFTSWFMAGPFTIDLFNTHYADPSVGILWPESQPTDSSGQFDPNYFDVPPESGTWLYCFTYRFPYTLQGGTEFVDISTPSDSVQFFGTLSPQEPLPSTAALYPYKLSGLPTFSNGPGDNWDTSAIMVDIYRTAKNGRTFYKVGEVPLGTATFTDSVTDERLSQGEELYTTGGVVGNDRPPKSKYFHLVNNMGYYGNVEDGGQHFPNRVRQSVQYDIDSCPATFFDDLDDEVMGLGSHRSIVVAFCRSSFYRLEGQFNELGQGFISHERLSDTVGCVNHQGIITTEFGIFFAGTAGIFWTDGYTFTRVTTELDRTYAALVRTENQRNRVCATYDADNRRVYWSFMTNPLASDCDVVWVLDLNWGISEKMSFTTLSGGEQFKTSAMTFYNGYWIRGHGLGYVIEHRPEYLNDIKIDPSRNFFDWTMSPVLYDFQSCATNFGTSQIKKWATRITVQAQNVSNLSLAISRQTDHGRQGWRALVPIRYRGNCLWGDPFVVWGDPTIYWEYDGMIDEFRRMPAGTLRCDWMAVRFQNANVIVQSSSEFGDDGTATVGDIGGGYKTAGLLNGDYSWPRWSDRNYTVSFDFDNYTARFPITFWDYANIEFYDPGNLVPLEAGQKWQVNGVPLNERLRLTAYNISYAWLADEQGAYHGATSSDGGANP